jgi:hypothetical protein
MPAVMAGYSGKRFIFEKAHELGVRHIAYCSSSGSSSNGGRVGCCARPAVAFCGSK